MSAPATTMRVAIADDEPLARERLKILLERHPEYEVVAECEDGASAVQTILDARPDVVLLDIRMPEMDGLEVVEALASRVEEEGGAMPAVVFCTAYDEYAVRAFELSALDYILKPADEERLVRALRRATAQRVAVPAGAAAAVPPELARFLDGLRQQRGYPPRFLVRDARGLYFVKSNDIDWVDAQGNYVGLHTNGRVHLVRDTMKAFEGKLDPSRFVRVHRSAIVNIDRIERLEPYAHGEYVITMKDGSKLTSSRAHSARLHELLK